MSIRRMLPFIFINVVISAIVVLAILYWWENRTTPEGETTVMTAVLPTISAETGATVAAAPVADTPATPENELPIHIVQAGDTLGSLSEFYEVSMADIMEVNGITNPNLLTVGQQLIIPVGGIPTATPAPTATPTPDILPSPLPTEPIEPGEVVIEITAVLGLEQLNNESVQIINSGTRQVALLDWKLIDEDGHIFSFGQVTLFGTGGGVLVHTTTGQDNATDLYWGLEEPIWQSGELVTLLDAEGTIQATYQIP